MKKYTLGLISLVSFSILSGADDTYTKRIIHEIVTTFMGNPYSFDIKEEVLLKDENGSRYFTQENATDPIERNWAGILPVHFAAKLGDVGDLKTLASWGANLHAKNKYDETPLLYAAQGGNFRAIHYLLQNGAKINKSIRPFADFSPFHVAVLLPKRSHLGTPSVIRTLQALLQADPQRTYLNQGSRIGTPLEIAVKEQVDPHIVRFLIMQGAKITDTVKKGLKKKEYKPIAKALKEGTLRSQMYLIN